ncbi:DUF397 domain-containing protein [Streptomyces sp. NPDC090023]|uniref:DUF397 domain-containing protein n=1 Tax=unclassified Streptomyces TaxID=2593676 RepID=UPI0038111FF5
MPENAVSPASYWFKSSYSGSNEPDCVAVALTWFKSSHSSNDGPCCVEVALTPTEIHIRDSKTVNGPQLAVPATTWTQFIHSLRGA